MTRVYLSEDIKPIEKKRSRVVTRGLDWGWMWCVGNRGTLVRGCNVSIRNNPQRSTVQ